MPTRAVDLHRLARKDVTREVTYYSHRSARKAAEFVAAMRKAVIDIGAGAESYPVESYDVRWLLLKKFPLLVRFTIVDDYNCQVIAVSHRSRRPGHWIGRLRRP
jgi:plasmid stabilization system protein ParE